MRMTEEQYLEFLAKSGSKTRSNPNAIAVAGLSKEEPKQPKYHNNKVEYDGHVFDSWKECRRYQTLYLMQRANLISNLRLQVPFVLEEAVILKGRRKPDIRYFADFTYTVVKTGEFVVEDVKSKITKSLSEYRNKMHLLKARYNIEIVEI